MHTSVPKDSPLGEWVLSLKDEDRRSLLQLLTSGPRGPPESVGQSAADALNAHLQALPLDNLRAVHSQTSASLPPFVWQMLADPHLFARGFYQPVEHSAVGVYHFPTWPWRFARTPARISRPAPLFGEDTRRIFDDLGLSPERIAALYASGATADEPVAAF